VATCWSRSSYTMAQNMTRKIGKATEANTTGGPMMGSGSAAGFDLEDLPIEESRCQPGRTWSLMEEAQDIIRELKAREEKKVWSQGVAANRKESAKWWGIIMERLPQAAHEKIRVALEAGQLREAMAAVAEGALELGKELGHQIEGAKGGLKSVGSHKGVNIVIALAYADAKGMNRQQAYKFLREGGCFFYEPYCQTYTLDPVPHNRTIALLKTWENRQRMKPKQGGS